MSWKPQFIIKLAVVKSNPFSCCLFWTTLFATSIAVSFASVIFPSATYPIFSYSFLDSLSYTLHYIWDLETHWSSSYYISSPLHLVESVETCHRHSGFCTSSRRWQVHPSNSWLMTGTGYSKSLTQYCCDMLITIESTSIAVDRLLPLQHL